MKKTTLLGFIGASILTYFWYDNNMRTKEKQSLKEKTIEFIFGDQVSDEQLTRYQQLIDLQIMYVIQVMYDKRFNLFKEVFHDIDESIIDDREAVLLMFREQMTVTRELIETNTSEVYDRIKDVEWFIGNGFIRLRKNEEPVTMLNALNYIKKVVNE